MKRLLLVLVLLLLLPPLLLAALFATETGTRMGLEQLQRVLPALQLDQVQGRLSGSLRVQRLSYRTDAVALELHDVQLDWEPWALWGRRLQLDRVHIGSAQVEILEGPLEEEKGPPLVTLPVDVVINDAHLQQLTLLRNGTGALKAEDVGLRGHWVGNRVRIDRLALALREPDLGRFELKGRLRLEDEAVLLERLALRGPGELHAAGRWARTGSSEFQLRWTQLRWPFTGEAQLLSPAGQAQWHGRPEDYRFKLEASLIESRASLKVEAAGHGNLESLRLERLVAEGLGGHLNGQATLAWAPERRVEAQGEFDGVQPQLLLPGLEGVLNGRFAATTVLKNGEPQVQFSFALRDSVWRGHTVQASAEGTYAEGRLALAQAELRTAGSRLRAQGAAWPKAGLRVRFNSPDLAPLWPGLSGRAEADVRLQGTWEGPRAEGHLRADRLRFQQFGVDLLRFDGGLDLRGQRRWEGARVHGRLQMRALRSGDMAVERLRAEGDVDLTGPMRLDLALDQARAGLLIEQARLQLEGRARRHRLELTAATERGDVNITLTGALQPRRQRWQGELTQARLSPPELPDWTLLAPAALRLSPQSQAIEHSCWQSQQAQVCAQLTRDERGIRGSAGLKPLALAYLNPLLARDWSLEGEVEGEAEFVLDASGAIRELNADVRSTSGSVRFHERPLLRFDPAALQLRQSQGGPLTAWAQLPVAGGLAQLEAEVAPGSVMAERALSGRLQLDLPELGWTRAFTTELSAIEGRIHGALLLGGALGSPRAQGALRLQQGRVRLAQPGIEITALEGELRGDADGRLQLTLVGESGGGQLRIEGQLAPEARPPGGVFTVKGERFQLIRLPDARVWVSPDLLLLWQGRQLEVTGTVLVPRADITPTTGGRGIGPSPDQVIVGPAGRTAEDGKLLQLSAEIQLRFGDDVRFKGYGLEAPLKGQLTLLEESGLETRAFGEIQLDGGEYQAYGQDLRITTGRLIYSGGYLTEPALDLRAQREPTEDVTVGVTVRGTLDRPQFALFSTPAMTQQQQLSWLVLGRPLEQTQNEGERSRLNAAALSLGLSGGDFLAQRLRSRLGVDEISIGARPTEGAEQARLTLGKHLSPRLYISYGIGLFEAGNVFRLVYELGRGFKLRTESGIESGADLLYTLER